MDKCALAEKKKYDAIWKGLPVYREISPGELFAPRFFEGFKGKIRPGQTLIDFGCGTARVTKEFVAKGLNVSLVDISRYCLDDEIRGLMDKSPSQVRFLQACLWQLPETLKSAHWAFCCDVMEHLPEEMVDEVLKGIAKRMRHGGYFNICLKPDLAGQFIGQPLHLTVKEASWWREKMKSFFTIVSDSELFDGLYYSALVSKA